MLASKRTLQYFAALHREGDNFNYDTWLKQAREEEDRERGRIASSTPEGVGNSGQSSPHTENRQIELGPLPVVTGQLRNRTRVISRRLPKPVSEKAKYCLRESFSKVCDAWDKSLEDRSRDSIYPYLKSVYAIVTRYRGRTHELLRQATKYSGVAFDRNSDPFAVIIRATSEQKLDAKAISKLSRALRYAAHRGRPPRLLIEFIKGLGGINACADRYARRLGRASRRKRRNTR
jgi:hypothetical protein